MIGMDDEETMMIERRAEVLQDVSDMRGKLYLWIPLFYYDLLQGFYTML
jgi:hypothetical protein